MEDSTNGEFRDFQVNALWLQMHDVIRKVFSYHLEGPPHCFWNCYKETGDDIEVAKLTGVRDLDVRGWFKMSALSSGVVCEIACMVKLTNGASGWELPVTLKINLPGQGGTEKKRRYSLLKKPRGLWMELNGGSFQSMAGETGEVIIDLYNHDKPSKSGLIIKGIIIRPKELNRS
ncbi:lectin-like [Pyrus x bretschneideri]|uniref:lectin-like n=1 Tax=Pyrus x bretschneideri TaxID=225117 RepID=UPI00202E4617|nr:lectin-like [Pyrus x bretschneideri]